MGPRIALIFGFLLHTLILLANAGPALRNNNNNGIPRPDEISISSAAVLLPANSSVSFPIEAYNGCFRWTINKASLVDLVVQDEDCGRKIWLKSAAANDEARLRRDSTWLWAEDIHTSKTLRCEVFVDTIEKIEILTTTRNLNKYEEQILTIRAFDADGNIFSSVEGLEVHWVLAVDGTQSDPANHIIQELDFHNSKIEISDAILKLEKMNKRGGALLVRAAEIGRVQVSAHLVGSNFANVGMASVTLNVLQPFLIHPANPVYLAPHSTLQFRLDLVSREGLFEPVDNSKNTYEWSSKDIAVARVDSTGRVTTLDKLGESAIEVVYSGMVESTRKTTVYVVEPEILSLGVLPKNATSSAPGSTQMVFMILGREYNLHVHVRDQNLHELDSLDSLQFKVDLSDSAFTTLHRSSNNAHTVVIPQQLGRTDISLSLDRVGDPRLGTYDFTPISFTQAATIVEPITFTSHAASQLYLPYDRDIKHSLFLTTKGGSSMYLWSSSNNSVVSVSNGHVLGHLPGTAVITCVDARDRYNRAQVTVSVALPKQLVFVPNHREFEVGKTVVIGVAMLTSTTAGASSQLANCSALPIAVALSGSDAFSEPEVVQCHGNYESIESEALLPCFCFRATSLREGHSRFTASYETLIEELDQYSRPKTEILSSSISVAGYRPLAIYPTRVLLTVGSSYKLAISGGPQPWQFQQVITPAIDLPDTNAAAATAHSAVGSGGVSVSFVEVLCKALGQQDLNITIGNPVSSTNPHPVTLRQTINLECSHPEKFLFHPNQPAQTGANCQEAVASLSPGDRPAPEFFSSLPTSYTLRNNRTVVFNVTVFDKHGHAYNNFSSLSFDLTSTNTSLIAPVAKDPAATPSKQQFSFKLAAVPGEATLQLQALGYERAVATAYRPPYLDHAGLSSAWKVTLKNNLRLVPSKLAIYNNPENKNTITAQEGSSQVEFLNNNPSVAWSEQVGQTLVIIPKLQGVVTITAIDLCLPGSDPAVATIHVSDINAIQIKGRDMLRLDDQMRFHVDVLDSAGNVFDPKQLGFIKFKYHVEGYAVEVTPDAAITDRSSIHYIAKGMNVGVSSISVSATNAGGSLVSSAPLQIHVYPPLKLVATGGPPFRAEIAYSISNEAIAEITREGTIVAKQVGETDVVVQAYFIGEERKDPNLRSVVKLKVKNINQIRIRASTKRLIAGEELMVHVEGGEGEPPIAWGGLEVSFKWEVENPVILGLSPVYELAGLSLDEEHGFIVKVRALSAGRSRIAVRVTSGPASLVSQTTSLQFDVIAPLQLRGSSFLSNDVSALRSWGVQKSLLLAPEASYQLTATDPQVEYQLLDAPCGTQATSSDSSGDAELSSNRAVRITNGFVSSTGVAGSATLLAREKRDGQVAIVRVNVKPVHHIELKPRAPVYYRLPVGSVMEFDVVMRDEVGQEFDSYDKAELDFGLSRQDIFSVEFSRTNETTHRRLVRVKGIRPGQAYLRLFSLEHKDKASVPALEHFQLIRVTNAIFPTNPHLHLGANINFTIPFPQDKTYHKVWSSGNEQILSVDADLGTAFAEAQGKAVVFHNSSVFTHTTVKVSKVTTIEFATELCVTTGSEQSARECKIGLKFLDVDGLELLDSDNIRQNIGFECNIRPKTSHTLRALPLNVAQDGFNACLIEILPSSTDTLLDEALLEVTVFDQSKSYTLTTEHSISFASAFIIRGTRDITLTPAKSSITVEVLSTKAVVVQSKDPDRIVARESHHDKTSNKYLFYISVQDGPSFTNTTVEFFSKDTKQREQISISFKAADPLKGSSGDGAFWLFLLAGLVGLVVVAFFVFSSLTPPARPKPSVGGGVPPPTVLPATPLPQQIGFQDAKFTHHPGQSPFVNIHHRAHQAGPTSPPRSPYAPPFHNM